jgi:branched-chain amino acid transport system substrate-binding protein
MKRRTFIGSAILASTSLGGAIWYGTSKKSGINTNQIQIGAILPLTGQLAYLGQGEKIGMELALENYPELKSRVKFVFEDSQGKPELAVSAAKKLLEVQNINVHVLSTTGVLLATLPMYKQSGKDILVFSQSMMPGITKDYPFAYRIYPSADEEMNLLAEYARRKKLLKIGTLSLTNRAGDEAAQIFKKKVEEFGGKVDLVESIPSTEKDFKTILSKIKNRNLDAVMVYAFAPTYPIVLKQMDEVGLTIPILGNLQLAIGGIEKQVSSRILERVVFPASRYYTDKDNPLITKFDEKVKAIGKEPNHDIAYFYDMTSILLESIVNAQSMMPSGIKSAILKRGKYEGVTGTIQINQDRDVNSMMLIVQHKPDGIRVIDLK